MDIFYKLIFSLMFFAVVLSADPLDTYDGTEHWYKDRISEKGIIVYYDPSYEKEVKNYLSYLKRKNKKIIFKKKAILSKINRNNELEDKSDEIGTLGTMDGDEKIENDTLVEAKKDNDSLFMIGEENKPKKNDFKVEIVKDERDVDYKGEKKKKKNKVEIVKDKRDIEYVPKKKKKYNDTNKYSGGDFVDDEELEDLD